MFNERGHSIGMKCMVDSQESRLGQKSMEGCEWRKLREMNPPKRRRESADQSSDSPVTVPPTQHPTHTHLLQILQSPCHSTPLECLRDLLSTGSASCSSMTLQPARCCPPLLFVTPPGQTITVNHHESCQVSSSRGEYVQMKDNDYSPYVSPYVVSLLHSISSLLRFFPLSLCTDGQSPESNPTGSNTPRPSRLSLPRPACLREYVDDSLTGCGRRGGALPVRHRQLRAQPTSLTTTAKHVANGMSFVITPNRSAPTAARNNSYVSMSIPKRNRRSGANRSRRCQS